MQAVILAAGKGTRMGNQQIPKPLTRVCGKTLLEHKLDVLPSDINEIILIIGHKGNLIQDHFGYSYREIPVRYIEDTTISGTAHALWHAKDFLKDRFLVMMGDDIYEASSLEEASLYDHSIVCKRASLAEPGSRVILNTDGSLSGFVTEAKYKQMFPDDGGLIFTGLYSLTPEIFKYSPVKMQTVEEWGLPQTLLSARKTINPKIIETDFWLSISSPEDIMKAENILSKERPVNHKIAAKVLLT